MTGRARALWLGTQRCKHFWYFGRASPSLSVCFLKRMCQKESSGRQQADLDTEETRVGRVGCPSPAMAEGRWERPGDYCCGPWHGWRQGGQAGSAGPRRGGGPRHRSGPLLAGPPAPRPPGLYCRRAETCRCFSGGWSPRRQATRVTWEDGGRHWPRAPGGAVIVGPATSCPGAEGPYIAL